MQPMTFSSPPSVQRQPAQASPLTGANGQGKSPPLETRPFRSGTHKSTHENIDATFQPPYGQPKGRKELLPPFPADSSSMGRPRPGSFGSDLYSRPSPNNPSSQVMEAAQSMATLPQPRHFEHMTAYPSPSESALEIPKKGIATPSTAASKGMPPPYTVSGSMKWMDYDASLERSAKRIRLDHSHELHQSPEPNRRHRVPPCSPNVVHETPRPSFQPPTPNLVSPRVSNPMTPAASSTSSDEVRQTWRLASISQPMPDRNVRRVSVSSLLSGSPELGQARLIPRNPSQAYNDIVISPLLDHSSPSRPRANSNTQTESYGVDRGLPDLDVPRNDDTAAINGVSPSQHGDLDAWLENVDLGVPEFGFGLQKREFVFAKGGYYASPVPIKIPRKLEPLPSTLLENPMNLLYFHHFLNHTARILVVHDCSQNPFRTILPQSKLFSFARSFN
jgi:hypothetical protein